MIGVVRRFLFETCFYLALVACSGYALFTIGPWLETRYLPVVGKLHIDAMSPGEAEGTTVVYASFRKLRACEYLGIAWFRGKVDEDGFERVPLVLMRKEGDTSDPNRPVGFQRSGPWIVSIPMAEIENNSFVRLSHRCFPLWTTTTDFYP